MLLPSGRRRRYFGYPNKLGGSADTPESAKSFASIVSPQQSQTRLRVKGGKCFRLDKPLPKKIADKYLHAAIAAQIPALLPPLKNTYRFREYEGNPMKFHSPHLEHHYDRSLYYIWLSKNDRNQLCNIVDAHLGSHERSHGEYRGIGNPMMRRLADYSHMPRTLSVLDDEVPDHKNLKSKFQKGIWDTPKTPRDRFVRDHGRSPAMDAICHLYPGDEKTKVSEKDVQECILAAKLLLGPYAGINTAFTNTKDIPAEILEMIEEEHKLEKQKIADKKDADTNKRPFGYNSSQVRYERKILAAQNFYNELKTSTVLPIPPPELFKEPKQWQRGKTFGKSHADLERIFGKSVKSMAVFNDPSSKSLAYGKSVAAYGKSVVGYGASVGDFGRRSTHAVGHHGHHHGAPKRRFNKDNITEDDYNDMYVHWVPSSEDLGTKTHVPSMTDISKLRKKLHLDQNPEDDHLDAALQELYQKDSFLDLPDPISKKILKNFDPAKKEKFTKSDFELLRNILFQQANKIESPNLKAKMRQIGLLLSQKVEEDEVVKASESVVSVSEESDNGRQENDVFEKAFGFVDKNMKEFMEEEDLDDDDHRTDRSSETELSDGPESFDLDECSLMNLECLDALGALGPPPFTSPETRKLIASRQNEDNSKPAPATFDVGGQMPEESNIFSKEHWAKSVIIQQ